MRLPASVIKGLAHAELPCFLGVRDFSRHFGVCEKTARRMIARGQIAAVVHRGPSGRGMVRIPGSELKRLEAVALAGIGKD